jgi:hypothetical protein
MRTTLFKLSLINLCLFFFQITPSAQCYDDVAQSVGVEGTWGSFGFTGGGGISFADFNGDGFDDLTFATAADLPLQFFENNGDGTFSQILPALVDNSDEVKSVTWIDIDNDGDKDLFVTAFQAPNRIFINDGDLNLTDMTLSMGLPLDNSTTFGANFGDYDSDGFLDLYIANYGVGMSAHTNSMYKNINGEFFEDVTIETGTANYCDPEFGGTLCDTSPGRQSFCSIFFDYDLDGDLDLYVSNDRMYFPNALFENNGDGTFTDVAEATLSNITIDAMNTGLGDSNGDGYFDIYVTNSYLDNSLTSALLVYDPDQNTYIESAAATGTEMNRLGWGGNFFDYDLDGDEDLYVCSGHAIFEEPNAFYVNDGNGNFTEPFATTGGLGGVDHTYSRCNAIGDYDNDGYQDIAVSGKFDQEHHLWHSCESVNNTFVKLDLIGQVSNADGYGALVEIYYNEDIKRIQKVSQNAYLSQNSDIITFGIGTASSIDSIVVNWPYPNSKSVLTESDILLNDLNIIVEDIPDGEEEEEDDDDDTTPTPGMQCYTDFTSDAGIDGAYGQAAWKGGGGASFVDFDGDGYDDLSFCTEAGQNVMFYTNDGDGTFTELSTPLVTNTDESKQILWVDYDNDGDKDIFISCYEAPNRLYQNDGNLNFTDVTSMLGLPLNNQPTFGASFGDIDMDGYLDLYITNYGGASSAAVNFMYKNNGGNSFTDITTSSGTSNGLRQSLCSSFFDYDLDGDLDLYVINDRQVFADALYQNDGTGVFTDVSASTNTQNFQNSYGVGIGDLDQNGYMDIFVSNNSSSRLLMNDNGSFTNEAPNRGATINRFSWGGSFFDYDNDRDLDLYVSTTHNDPNKPNAFLENDGQGFFTEPLEFTGGLAGIDIYSSFANIIGDIDNDGNLDIVTSNDEGNEFKVLRNCEDNGNNYIGLSLEGVDANKDAYGSLVQVYSGEEVLVFQKMNAISYLGQHSDVIHVGLGGHSNIDSLVINWPKENSTTTLYNGDLIINTVNHIIEGDLGTPPPSCIVGTVCDDGDDCTTGETYDANCNCQGGIYTDSDNDGICDAEDICPNNPDPDCIIIPDFPTVDEDLNLIRKWNEILLESIRLDLARPTVHARNLFHTSIAMWDAYAIYNDPACPYLIGNTVDGYTSTFDEFNASGDVNENLEITVSYACYRILKYRFQNSPNAGELHDAYDYLMSQLELDIDVTSIDYSTGDPAHLGNYIAEEIINFGLQDGANEQAAYGNDYYEPVNDPLVMDAPGNPTISDYNRWQPLTLETFIDQSGNVIPLSTPDFLSPEWGQVSNFALEAEDMTSYFRDGFEYNVFHDPGEPPLHNLDGSDNTDIFQWGFTLVSKWSSHLSPDDGVMIDISPASLGNPNAAPTDFANYDQYYLDEGGTPTNGYSINPTTAQPYNSNIVPRGDYSRVLAEFWADGPDSETPPGHWFTLLNYVSDHPELEKKYEGAGPVLEDTEWYVKSYFTMGGAMHDAAVSAWGVKGWYDYIRPVSAIRAMADLGQSSDPSLPNYHAGGMQLTDGLVELVTLNDPLVGANNEHLNKIKLYSWLGHDEIIDEETDQAGVGWILAEEWAPYQRASFVTPPFAGYVSGHSTFSRAAAEVMTMLTGDAYFPGGMGTFLAEKDEFLVFEDGPSQDIELQWATYKDAADQSALSRIWGGIHPPFDDIPGREIGLVVGESAFNKAKTYFSDVDQDDVCDPNDLCDNFDDNLIGTPCDDGDVCTEGETYDENCGCSGGVSVDADDDGICAAEDPDDNDHCIPDDSDDSCDLCDFTEIVFDDFEIDQGNWSDRAPDAFWGIYPQAFSGTRCFMIRDDSGIASSMSSEHSNYLAYDELKISFTFVTEGFDATGEEFSLQFSNDGGASYTTLKTWEYDTDFVNGVRQFPTETVSGIPFGVFSTFRFICDGSDDSDEVFVDDILIEGCIYPQNAGGETEPSYRSSQSLAIYPNPIESGSSLILNNPDARKINSVSILNAQGRIVRSYYLGSEATKLELETLDLPSGVFVLNVNMDKATERYKFIVLK